MAEQVLVQFKVDKLLKQEVTENYEFKKAFYELREQAADVPEMSLDEINKEIAVVRAERKR